MCSLARSVRDLQSCGDPAAYMSFVHIADFEARNANLQPIRRRRRYDRPEGELAKKEKSCPKQTSRR
jgi:hypothetical protein